MAVPSNQKVGELARIAYLALLHAETELGEVTNTFDGEKWAEKLRGIRSAILAMFSNTDEIKRFISSEMKAHWLLIITEGIRTILMNG